MLVSMIWVGGEVPSKVVRCWDGEVFLGCRSSGLLSGYRRLS